jgi:hypothetical protein
MYADTAESVNPSLSSTQKIKPGLYCFALIGLTIVPSKGVKAVLVALIAAAAVTLVGLVGYLLYLAPGPHDRLE